METTRKDMFQCPGCVTNVGGGALVGGGKGLWRARVCFLLCVVAFCEGDLWTRPSRVCCQSVVENSWFFGRRRGKDNERGPRERCREKNLGFEK